MNQHHRPDSFAGIWRASAVIILLSILLHQPVLETWSLLRFSMLHFVLNFSDVSGRLVTANSGTEVLPVEVQEMLVMLREHPEVTQYGLSEQLASVPAIYQRSVEGLWPRELVPLSPYQFVLPAEQDRYPQCAQVSEGEEVVLISCP
jgi:hypothetical protein